MMIVYSILLVLSAWIASFGLIRVVRRVGKTLAFDLRYAPALASGSMIAFLMVISAPPALLVAALIGTGYGLWELTRGTQARPAMLGLCGFLGAVGMQGAAGGWPDMLPWFAWFTLAAVTMFAAAHVAGKLQHDLRGLFLAAAAGLLPLMVAPLIFSTAHDSLLLDGLILLAALLGAAMALTPTSMAGLAVQLPVALLLAGLQWQAVRYGAWPCAAASLLLWFGVSAANARKGNYATLA